jgi:hypothetical protein
LPKVGIKISSHFPNCLQQSSGEANQQIVTTLMRLATLFLRMIARIIAGIRFENYIDDHARPVRTPPLFIGRTGFFGAVGKIVGCPIFYMINRLATWIKWTHLVSKSGMVRFRRGRSFWQGWLAIHKKSESRSALPNFLLTL